MKTILLATDADEVFDEVDAALADASTQIHRVRAGKQVRSAAGELGPDLVILDMQIGNMGGAATCLDLRLEEGAGRLDPQKVLLLLDRADDVFIARRSGADHWISKPLDALKLRNGAKRAELGAPEAPVAEIEHPDTESPETGAPETEPGAPEAGSPDTDSPDTAQDAAALAPEAATELA